MGVLVKAGSMSKGRPDGFRMILFWFVNPNSTDGFSLILNVLSGPSTLADYERRSQLQAGLGFWRRELSPWQVGQRQLEHFWNRHLEKEWLLKACLLCKSVRSWDFGLQVLSNVGFVKLLRGSEHQSPEQCQKLEGHGFNWLVSRPLLSILTLVIRVLYSFLFSLALLSPSLGFSFLICSKPLYQQRDLFFQGKLQDFSKHHIVDWHVFDIFVAPCNAERLVTLSALFTSMFIHPPRPR